MLPITIIIGLESYNDVFPDIRSKLYSTARFNLGSSPGSDCHFAWSNTPNRDSLETTAMDLAIKSGPYPRLVH